MAQIVWANADPVLIVKPENDTGSYCVACALNNKVTLLLNRGEDDAHEAQHAPVNVTVLQGAVDSAVSGHNVEAATMIAQPVAVGPVKVVG